MQPTNLLSTAARWWGVLLVAVLLASGAGYLFSVNMPATHEARVRLLVGPMTEDSRVLDAAGQLSRTYGELATSQAVVEGTIEALDLDHSAGELRAAIRPTVDSATRILIIRVRDGDPDRAAAIANHLASELRTLPDSAGGGPDGTLRVIDEATPGKPVGIDASIITALAGLAGFVAAVTLVLLLENLNRTIRSEEELAAISGVDYLGHVAATGRHPKPGRLVVESAPDSARAADYRMVATKIELIARREELRSLLVLGIGRAQGSGELAANVARVLSERRHCVTLVDANPRKREITTLLGLGDQLGLTDMLEVNERSGDDSHPSAFTFSSDPRFFVIPFGRANDPSSTQATGAPWVLDRLLEQADLVVVNAAPAERSAASLVWAGTVDATILLLPRSRVNRAELGHLIESLRLVGGNVIGAIFEDRGPLVATSRPERAPRVRPTAPTANDGGAGEEDRAAAPPGRLSADPRALQPWVGAEDPTGRRETPNERPPR